MSEENYELEGTVKVIFETQTFPSGFAKREFVVTTEERFPQDIKLECIRDKIDLLDKLSEGERVKVAFNLRGNEYKERYFVNLQAWRIEKTEGATSAAGADDDDRPPLPTEELIDDDNLPF